jgi:hypothetical protein
MRRTCLHLFPLISVLILFSTFSYGQAWSGILATSRAIDWTHAGLPATFTDKGGSNVETTGNPWTPPTRTQSGSTLSPSGNASTDLSNINSALSSCPDGHYILLGPGTFQIQGTIVMYQHSCSLRGSGPQSTTVSLSGSGQFYMGATSSGGTCALSAGLSAGSTSVTCSGSRPAVGNIAIFNQCDTGYSGTPCSGASADNGAMFVCFQHGNCMTDAPGSGNDDSQYQTVIITSVSGSGPYTVGFSSGLYMPNWSTSQTATLSWNSPTYYGIGVGLEDMTIYSTTTSESVQPQSMYASWVKGVRFIGSNRTNFVMDVSGSKNFLIANNYFFAGYPLSGAYPPGPVMDTTSDSLVLNNISTSGVPWLGEMGLSGNVYGYNYGRDTFTMYVENQWFDHQPEGNFTLNEGNQAGAMTEDDTYGSHHLNTYFRNYLSCWDPPYVTSNARGLQVDSYQRFTNLIGNAVGTMSQCPTYESSGADGAAFIINASDVLVGLTTMRWGNVTSIGQSTDTPANSGVRFELSEVPSAIGSTNSYCTASGSPWSCCTGSGAGRCSIAAWKNAVPASNTLPPSFFLPVSTAHPNGGTGLSWWQVCKNWTTFPTTCAATQTQPFPPVGPDVSGGAYVNGYAYDIPAQVAWLNLPIDTNFQASYTITGSSWSGGTETLTVSGLPNATHLMGAFQLSGVNSACSSGSTINSANEILITGSSSTTVQYALASNPGTSCTGTMKFPDVRQFDERVYQADNGGDTSVNPPSGLSATVQ